jgi:outer membrane protein assembly factor BamB
VWTAQPFPIRDLEFYRPPWIIVDAAGRIYVGFDDSPQKPGGAQSSSVSLLDPEGNTLWTRSIQGTLGSPSLDRSGTLWVVGAAVDPTTFVDGGSPIPGAVDLLGLSASGGTPVKLRVPAYPGQGGLLELDPQAAATASDGSFVLEGSLIGNLVQGPGLERVAATGALLWHWPLDPSNEYFQFQGPFLLAQDDRVIAASTDGLLAFDASGNPTWRISIGIQAAAIDPSGQLVAVSQASSDALALVTIDASGGTVSTAPLGSGPETLDATRLAIAADGTRLVLLADESPSPGQTKTHVTVSAIDASGSLRWTTPLDAQLPYDPASVAAHYGLFVDAGGTVIVTAGSMTGLDLGSGSVVWTLQPPDPTQCLRAAVLGAGGSILASQCDGTIFLARDP